MSTSEQPPFSYLRRKIREWQTSDLLRPGDHGWEHFRQVAPLQLTRILEELQQALQSEGIRTTVRELSEDSRRLSLWIDEYDVELCFGPTENPHAFRFSARRHADNQGLSTTLIPYRALHLDLGRVVEIVEDVVLRVLGPRRANQGPEAE